KACYNLAWGNAPSLHAESYTQAAPKVSLGEKPETVPGLFKKGLNLENYTKSDHTLEKQRFFPTLETFWTAMKTNISDTLLEHI
ncbi:MAG: hypothetical protein RI573_11905, partial [Balneolaceae bacterium]|nr:hypothetical protein [Balneolaceae bacterium]